MPDLLGAERHLRESLEVLAGLELAFEVAVTRLDLAEVAGCRGDLGAAAEHLECSRQSFAALGAPTYLDRAEHLARRLEGSLAGDVAAGEQLPDIGPPSPEAEPSEAEPEGDAPAPQRHLLDDT